MNTNEAKFIGRAQVDGENATDKAQPRIPIGSTVKLKCWPVPGKIIGHSDGSPIIELEPCTISDDMIDSYTDANGLKCLPFYQTFKTFPK